MRFNRDLRSAAKAQIVPGSGFTAALNAFLGFVRQVLWPSRIWHCPSELPDIIASDGQSPWPRCVPPISGCLLAWLACNWLAGRLLTRSGSVCRLAQLDTAGQLGGLPPVGRLLEIRVSAVQSLSSCPGWLSTFVQSAVPRRLGPVDDWPVVKTKLRLQCS